MVPGIAGALKPRRYADEGAMQALTGQPPSLRENIDRALQTAADETARLTRIKELLDKNPEVEELVTLLQQGFRY